MPVFSQSKKTGKDSANNRVPAKARMGRLSLTMAWWAVCSAMFYIVVGASLALSYGARNALIGMVLSVISYGLINSVLSRFAIRSGLSVALFSRLLFGSLGASLATLIYFSTAIYYAVFEGAVIAVAFNYLYPQMTYPLAALMVVLYSVPLILGKGQSVRLMFTGPALPANQESVFWFNMLEIPPKSQADADANMLQMAFRSRIKIFYRPAALPGTPTEAIGQVQWKVVPASSGQGFALQAYNPSAFHVSLVELKLVAGAQRWLSEDGMVAPGQTRQFALPTLKAMPGAGARVEFSAINDYGAVLPTEQSLKP